MRSASPNKLRDELLDRELFDTLWEVKVLVEGWRHTYNRIRPHSALGYRPPAPETIVPQYTFEIHQISDLGQWRVRFGRLIFRKF